MAGTEHHCRESAEQCPNLEPGELIWSASQEPQYWETRCAVRSCASLPGQALLPACENHPRIELQRASRAWEIQPILCQWNVLRIVYGKPKRDILSGNSDRNNRLTAVPSPQLSLAVLWVELSHEENNAAFSRVEFILSWEEGLGLNKTSASSDAASWEAAHS